nr:protein cornichon homolog 4-like [Lepeophtheirus salmonis]
MFGDLFVFSFNLLDTTVLMFILIYFIITLSDLECDYLNAQECCGKLNFWNVPKYWLQISMILILLLSGHWFLFLLNIPICIFLTQRFFNVPRGNTGEYDPSEIHDHGMLKKHLIGVGFHLSWQMIGFFVYLYCLLDAVMNEPVVMQQDDVQVLNKPAAQELYTPSKYTSDAGEEM